MRERDVGQDLSGVLMDHLARTIGTVNMDKLTFGRDGRIACLCVRAMRPFRPNVVFIGTKGSDASVYD